MSGVSGKLPRSYGQLDIPDAAGAHFPLMSNSRGEVVLLRRISEPHLPKLIEEPTCGSHHGAVGDIGAPSIFLQAGPALKDGLTSSSLMPSRQLVVITTWRLGWRSKPQRQLAAFDRHQLESGRSASGHDRTIGKSGHRMAAFGRKPIVRFRVRKRETGRSFKFVLIGGFRPISDIARRYGG